MAYLALVVDDDLATQFIYQQALTPMGFHVTTATNGADGLEALRLNTFHLALLDLLLPKIGGAELIAYIHDAAHLRDMRVAIISAHPRYKEKIPLGPNDIYLAKPVMLQTIREIAAQIMQAGVARASS